MRGYLPFFIVAVLSRLLLELGRVGYVSEGQRAVWSWGFFAVFVVCFGGAVWLARAARLPLPSETVPASLTLPMSVGVVVALLTIWSDVAAPVAYGRGVASIHVQGWMALPFYAYGAMVLTVVFHFLPIAFAACIARRLPRAGRLGVVTAAVLAVALSEDLGFFMRRGSPGTVESLRHLLSVVANATEAIFIYRLGLLGGLAQRSATYAVWHMIWPAIWR